MLDYHPRFKGSFSSDDFPTKFWRSMVLTICNPIGHRPLRASGQAYHGSRLTGERFNGLEGLPVSLVRRLN